MWCKIKRNGLFMGQSLEVQRHLSEMKWKLSSCEDECVCYLCVSSVMEWQLVQGVPVHAGVIINSP